ncbi:MAG: extracellular solute-binding protein, partial [Thermoproteota archaeon]|nr:extracellular solute-binding protein [Thermoproteota archaeon]
MSPIVIVIALLVIIITPTTLQPSLATANYTIVPSNQTTSTVVDKTNVTLRGIFDDISEPGLWNQLLQPALDELNRRHPDMNIQMEYDDFPYPETRNQILDRLSNGESVDIVSVDQIWLGEFAERGLIRNLTSEFEQWGRMGDLYAANLNGCVYNNTIYALWLWTD